jgi:hypothetical protein
VSAEAAVPCSPAEPEPRAPQRPRLLAKRVTKRDDGRLVVYYEFGDAGAESVRQEREG